MAEETALNELLEESGADDTLQADDDASENKKKKFKLNLSKSTLIKIGIGVLVIILLVIAAWLFWGGSDSTEKNISESESEDIVQAIDDDMEPASQDSKAETANVTSPAEENNAVKPEIASDNNTAAITPMNDPVISGNDKMTNKRLTGISSSMVATGVGATSSSAVPDVTSDTTAQQPTAPSEQAHNLRIQELEQQLAALKAENAALKGKVDSLTVELRRKDYSLRTRDIMSSQDTAASKQKFEKPLHIELEPKWGNFEAPTAKK